MSTEVDRVVAENFQDGESGELVNGNVDFTQEVPENEPVKDGRIFKKAKRTIRINSRKSESEEEGSTSPGVGVFNGVPGPFLAKNSRKAKNGRGRGLPKKGGAGGKGTWGKLGSELFEPTECKDVNDPNYDSDSQDKCKIVKILPEMNPQDLVAAITPILKEYLEHGDSAEVKMLLSELNLGQHKYKVPELAVSLALDRHAPHRELTSCLISDLHGGQVINQIELTRGFDELLNNLYDLTLDTPDAAIVIGQFIARAVADDCLPSDFIKKYKGHVENVQVREALEKAEVLLSMNASIALLDQVWGKGGGCRPVKYLIKKMVLLLHEYIDAGDASEALRCLKELDVPHFHHELVYQAAVIAIENTTEAVTDKMVHILKFLTSINVVTPDCFSKGVKRVFEDMPEICVDVPAAYSILERLGNKLYDAGVLTDDLMKEMPARGRKRFVSEGDGGKVKDLLTQ